MILLLRWFLMLTLVVTWSETLLAKINGSVSTELRVFGNDDRSSTADTNLTVAGDIDIQLKKRSFEARFWNKGRYDLLDPNRYLFLPNENWLGYQRPTLRLRAGYQIEDWSMTEIFRPSDVFNARNWDSEIQDLEKIGEMALSARVQALGGFISAYFMPLFFAPSYPVESVRLNPVPPELKLGGPAFANPKGGLGLHNEFADQFAFRYSTHLGPADLAVHYINHIDRSQPILMVVPGQQARLLFFPVTQIGLTSAVALGAWVLKFDATARAFKKSLPNPLLQSFSPGDHTTVATGFERTMSFDSGAELTVFAEYQKVIAASESRSSNLSVFQNDLATGARWTRGDEAGTTVRGLMINDLSLPAGREIVAVLDFQRRFGADYKLTVGYRAFIAGTSSDTATEGLAAYDKADHAYLNVAKHF